MKALIIGDGLLGSELHKQTSWDYISRRKNGIDFCVPPTYANYLDDYDCIINCVANTDTYSDDREGHWNVNYKGVADLVHLCNQKEKLLVHISTDYIYSNSKQNCKETEVPVHCATWYGYTKLLADGYVQLKSNNYLLIRCTHKPTPFPYDKAYVNLIGNYDYVDVIAEIIVKLIEKGALGTYNVGTEVKSMHQMAKDTSEGVIPINGMCNNEMPLDVSMDVTKLTEFLS